MTDQTRNNRPVSVTLTPAGFEGLTELKTEMSEPVASRVIDTLIRAEMGRRGFTLRESRTDMPTPIDVNLLLGGSPLRHIRHQGMDYFEVPDEGSFTIQLRNSGLRRRLAVVSVDGLNVIDGKAASRTGQGWVVPGLQQTVIKGWLRDNEEAAAFQLKGNTKGSYTAQMGNGEQNVGVIGIMVYDEVQPVQYRGGGSPSQWLKTGGMVHDTFAQFGATKTAGGLSIPPAGYASAASSTLASAPATKGATGATSRRVIRRRKSVQQSVGTGYGEKVEQSTRTVTFDREDKPCQMITIRYGTRADLIAWGVPVAHLATHSAPNPFPADEASCPAPPGWAG